jgi:hypothetical protein
MTVALGTLVYSFASTAFGGFGSGFSNLVQSAGQQLQENIVVEQVFFFSSNSSWTCAPNPPFLGNSPATCGGVMYVRNVGGNPVTLDTIYVGNVTSGAALTTVTSVAPCTSNGVGFIYGDVCFTVNDPVTHLHDTNVLANPSAYVIMPQHVLAIYFVLPTDYSASPTSCAPATPSYCAVVHGGTVLAFTIVTSRGNEFVAYEKA